MRVGEVVNERRKGSIERQYQPTPACFRLDDLRRGRLLPPRLLWDPAGRLAELKKLTAPHRRHFGDDGQHVPTGGRIFAIAIARSMAAGSRPRFMVIGCAFQSCSPPVSGPLCHQWCYLLNEKGGVAAAEALPRRPNTSSR